jgi:hypothetical protein
MRIVKLIAIGSVVALASCQFGMRGSELPVAQRPGGAAASIEVSSGKYVGELIAVQDDGVVISGGRIMFAPFTAMKTFSLDMMGKDYSIDHGELPNAEKLARLRAVSHFPQGLTPDIRRRLLALSGQTEVLSVQ